MRSKVNYVQLDGMGRLLVVIGRITRQFYVNQNHFLFGFEIRRGLLFSAFIVDINANRCPLIVYQGKLKCACLVA